MFPLLLALCIDFYIIARIIVDGVIVSLLTAATGGIFIALWFVLPHVSKDRV
jgi:hypothetical protein